MSVFKDAKTFANTFIYSLKDEDSGYNIERFLIEYITDADRINKTSDSFTPVRNEVKVRQTSAVLYRILMDKDVYLCINNVETPPSFKVFYAKDIKGDKQPKIFIDVTGLIVMNPKTGLYTVKGIDKLCSYLFSALIYLMYYRFTTKITGNANVIKSSAICFSKMFCTVMDSLRPVNYLENKDKIQYLSTVYFMMNIVGKDIKSARQSSVAVNKFNQRDCLNWDFYCDPTKDFNNIDLFITSLADNFKFKELTTDVFISKWINLFYRGTMYGLELLPAFLTILSNAYTGAYLNNQKLIENMCSRDMVDVCTTLLRVGSSCFEGYKYESGEISNIEAIIANQDKKELLQEEKQEVKNNAN